MPAHEPGRADARGEPATSSSPPVAEDSDVVRLAAPPGTDPPGGPEKRGYAHSASAFHGHSVGSLSSSRRRTETGTKGISPQHTAAQLAHNLPMRWAQAPLRGQEHAGESPARALG